MTCDCERRAQRRCCPGLQDLYDRHRSDGFTVLAFPCNQFGNQEPDECPEIKAFVEAEYHVTFPVFSKV